MEQKKKQQNSSTSRSVTLSPSTSRTTFAPAGSPPPVPSPTSPSPPLRIFSDCETHGRPPSSMTFPSSKLRRTRSQPSPSPCRNPLLVVPPVTLPQPRTSPLSGVFPLRRHYLIQLLPSHPQSCRHRPHRHPQDTDAGRLLALPKSCRPPLGHPLHPPRRRSPQPLPRPCCHGPRRRPCPCHLLLCLQDLLVAYQTTLSIAVSSSSSTFSTPLLMENPRSHCKTQTPSSAPRAFVHPRDHPSHLLSSLAPSIFPTKSTTRHPASPSDPLPPSHCLPMKPKKAPGWARGRSGEKKSKKKKRG